MEKRFEKYNGEKNMERLIQQNAKKLALKLLNITERRNAIFKTVQCCLHNADYDYSRIIKKFLSKLLSSNECKIKLKSN